VRTQVDSSELAPSEPAMCGRATLAMEVSRTSMKVARVTVKAMSHGLWRGRQAAMSKDWSAVMAAVATNHPCLFSCARGCLIIYMHVCIL